LVEKTVRPNSKQPPNEKGNKSRILKKDHRKRMSSQKLKLKNEKIKKRGAVVNER
jgi:hypothetical protein